MKTTRMHNMYIAALLALGLFGLAPAAASTASAGRFAEGRPDIAHEVRDITFRRGRQGEGRIVVDLSDASTGIDIRQQGQTLIVELLKTRLPDPLRKRYDVNDFA